MGDWLKLEVVGPDLVGCSKGYIQNAVNIATEQSIWTAGKLVKPIPFWDRLFDFILKIHVSLLTAWQVLSSLRA